MNSKSNLAYDSSYRLAEPSYAPHSQSNVRIRVSNKKEQVAQKRANVRGIACLLFVAALAFCVLFRGVMITDKASQVDSKRSELEALVTANEKLQFEIDRSLDLNNVETIARNELGMRRAEKYQTIYIDLEQTDYVEKVSHNNFSPVKSFLTLTHKLAAYLD